MFELHSEFENHNDFNQMEIRESEYGHGYFGPQERKRKLSLSRYISSSSIARGRGTIKVSRDIEIKIYRDIGPSSALFSLPNNPRRKWTSACRRSARLAFAWTTTASTAPYSPRPPRPPAPASSPSAYSPTESKMTHYWELHKTSSLPCHNFPPKLFSAWQLQERKPDTNNKGILLC